MIRADIEVFDQVMSAYGLPKDTEKQKAARSHAIQVALKAATEVPLDFFLEPASRLLHSRMFRGAERFFYAYPYGDYYIWGATAGILSNLCDVLRASDLLES